ncbi:hypothetical protein D3C71_1060640 [compost metagenome]
MVDHYVDVPDGAVLALESFGELEFPAVAFVTQTANCRAAVIGPIDRDVFLIGGLEVRAVAGITGKFNAKRNRQIRRLRGALGFGDHIHFFRHRGVHFCLTICQGFIHRFGHNGVNLLLRKILCEDRNWAKRGDDRHC